MENINFDRIVTRKIDQGWEAFYFQDWGWNTADHWPDAFGKTQKDAISNLKKKYVS